MHFLSLYGKSVRDYFYTPSGPSPDKTSPSLFLTLPDELILQTISSVSQSQSDLKASTKSLIACSGVCRELRRICNSPELWQKILPHFGFFEGLSRDSFFQTIDSNKGFEYRSEVQAHDSSLSKLTIKWQDQLATVKITNAFEDRGIVSESHQLQLLKLDRIVLKTLDTPKDESYRNLVIFKDFLVSQTFPGKFDFWNPQGDLVRSIEVDRVCSDAIVFGECLAIKLEGGNIGLWNSEGEQVRVFETPQHEWSASFSALLAYDNHQLAVGSAVCGEIYIWNENGILDLTLRGHRQPITCLTLFAFQLVSGSKDNEIKLWNMKDGSCSRTLKGHSAGLEKIVAHQGLLLSCDSRSVLRSWNLQGDCLQALSGSPWILEGQLYSSARGFFGNNLMNKWSLVKKECPATVNEILEIMAIV